MPTPFHRTWHGPLQAATLLAWIVALLPLAVLAQPDPAAMPLPDLVREGRQVVQQRDTLKNKLGSVSNDIYRIHQRLETLDRTFRDREPESKRIADACYGTMNTPEWCQGAIKGFLPVQENLEAEKRELIETLRTTQSRETELGEALQQLTYRGYNLQKALLNKRGHLPTPCRSGTTLETLVQCGTP